MSPFAHDQLCLAACGAPSEPLKNAPVVAVKAPELRGLLDPYLSPREMADLFEIREMLEGRLGLVPLQMTDEMPPHCRATEEQNPRNAMGLYLLDAFGNLELLYRDPSISSVAPVPLAPRYRPPVQNRLAQWGGQQCAYGSGDLRPCLCHHV